MDKLEYDKWKLDNNEIDGYFCPRCELTVDDVFTTPIGEICEKCFDDKDHEIDFSSLEVEGIDTRDYPDFCDAYICSGQYNSGDELTDSDLDKLNDDCELVYNLVQKHLY